MKDLKLEGSAKTPSVLFLAREGKLELKGRSIPENSIEFYKPLLDWLDVYRTDPQEQTIVDMKLEYFNTSSSKCILDLFKKLEDINRGNTQINVNWFFEEDDEDMEEAGEDYQAIINLPFTMIEVDEI